MKRFVHLIAYLGLFLILSFCKTKDAGFDELRIKNIKSATISKYPHFITGDSIRSIPFEYINKFVITWNNPERIALTKCMAKFKVDIQLKNDSVRSFYLNSNIIKEKTDYYHYSNDSTLGERLWKLSYKY